MKTSFYNSSKFWISALGLVCVTVVQMYSMHIKVPMPMGFIYFVGGVIAAFGGLKTYQNVALTNGNGGAK